MWRGGWEEGGSTLKRRWGMKKGCQKVYFLTPSCCKIFYHILGDNANVFCIFVIFDCKLSLNYHGYKGISIRLALNQRVSKSKLFEKNYFREEK